MASRLHFLRAKFGKELNPMKTTTKIFLTATALFASASLFAQGPGNGPGPMTGAGRPPVAAPATAEEMKTIAFMREEEKLARDVYCFLYERWGLAVFDRIADSEQRHFETMGTLLTRYAIPDPAVSNAPGVFSNEVFTKLYAELTAKGSASVKDALEVGVAIEKLDIADLEKAIPATAKYDLKRVYTNLMMASHSHLEAFEFNLELYAQ